MSCSQKNRPVFPWRIVSAERRLRNNLSSREGSREAGRDSFAHSSILLQASRVNQIGYPA
jgi:hypothetical protein